MTIIVERTPLSSPIARTLIDALNRELLTRYPEPGATHFELEANEVAVGEGAFVVALADRVPAGCGAVRRIRDEKTVEELGENAAELKRMYVVPAVRGRGIGRAILVHLEEEARALGVKRLLLETGIRQAEAQALYTSAGFRVIPAFGKYRQSAVTSVCMEKVLT